MKLGDIAALLYIIDAVLFLFKVTMINIFMLIKILQKILHHYSRGKKLNTQRARRALREHRPLPRPMSNNIHQTSEKKIEIHSE